MSRPTLGRSGISGDGGSSVLATLVAAMLDSLHALLPPSDNGIQRITSMAPSLLSLFPTLPRHTSPSHCLSSSVFVAGVRDAVFQSTVIVQSSAVSLRTLLLEPNRGANFSYLSFLLSISPFFLIGSISIVFLLFLRSHINSVDSLFTGRGGAGCLGKGWGGQDRDWNAIPVTSS